MPIYVYACEHCKAENEEMFSIKARPDFINCKSCGKAAHRVISPGQFTVNGANAANNYSGDSNYHWVGGDD